MSRLGPETRAIIRTLKPHYEESLRQPPWEFRRYGEDNYRIFIDQKNNNRIAMTGSDVTTKLNIPFPHQWLRVYLFHTTSSPPTASTDALYVLISRPLEEPLTYFEDYLWRKYDITVGRYTISFPDTFKYDRGTYDVILNTTSGEYVYPMIKVRRLSM